MMQRVLSSAHERILGFLRLDSEDVARAPMVRAYYEAARHRLNAARSLRADGAIVAALVLYREATLLFGRMLLASRASSAEATSLDPARLLEQLGEVLADLGRKPPEELVRQRVLLVNPDVTALDRLDSATASVASEELDQVAEWLSSLVETRSRRQRWVGRVISLSLVGCVALGSVGAVWARRFPETNLALRAAVSASGSAFGTSPEGAVDGFRYGQLGFHSDAAPPWLVIDLGRGYWLTRVEAYGRGDCCYDQSLPLVFEVSEDGNAYRTLAQRNRIFSQTEPWVIRPAEQVVRFLRFRTLHAGPLVLGEVEAYGREAGAEGGSLVP